MRSRIACGVSPVSALRAIWIRPAFTFAIAVVSPFRLLRLLARI
jgi:hypothetical protein